MLELENLGLIELNAQEVQETEGGLFFIPIVIMCVLIVAASVYATSQGQYQEGQP
jgi:hypothetical protein